MEGTGVEWRGGEGRVPDCLGGLSPVGISTQPWTGQPPSYYYALAEGVLSAVKACTPLENFQRMPTSSLIYFHLKKILTVQSF